MKYLALLRGINVGGNNIIRMADLKSAMEAMGLKDVITYIQSGNVVFSSPASGPALAQKIEKGLSKRFGYNSRVVMVSQAELTDVVSKAPKGFGSKPDTYRYDAIFLRPPLTARAAIGQVPTHPEVDQVWAGRHALYFSRLASKATKSRLGKIVGTKIYQDMTIRNWNTTTKLLALMRGE